MNNTVSTPKPLVKSKCCGSDMVSTGSGEGTYFWICLSCQKPCDPSETDESPVESVSQPKAVDGYLKEFDEYMTSKWDSHLQMFPEADTSQWNSGFGVAQEMAESFLSSSIERARQEGRKEMMGDILKACSDGKATLTLDIKKMFPEEVK